MVDSHAMGAEGGSVVDTQAWGEFFIVIVARPALDPHEAIHKTDYYEDARGPREHTGEHRRYRLLCSICGGRIAIAVASKAERVTGVRRGGDNDM